MIIYDPTPGASIKDALHEAVRLASVNGVSVKMKFNGAVMVADPGPREDIHPEVNRLLGEYREAQEKFAHKGKDMRQSTPNGERNMDPSIIEGIKKMVDDYQQSTRWRITKIDIDWDYNEGTIMDIRLYG